MIGIQSTLTTASSLKSKSNRILSIFTKTIADLTATNNEVDKIVAINEQKKAVIDAELADLQGIKTGNQHYIERLNKIFE